MKAVILAGGLGTRLSEETQLRPKPMVEIGGMPILWHIMKIYSAHGISDFVVCLGYKGYIIKEYFANYFLHMSDVTIDLEHNGLTVHEHFAEPWRITLVDTGVNSMTGGRLQRVAKYLDEDETFCFTYGDGLSNVNITDTIRFHKEAGKLATVTAVLPPGRFGALETEGNLVRGFQEKPRGDNSWINGGFFVLEPQVLSYIQDETTVWESEPMNRLASEGQLAAYMHDGFWQPMDTVRDRMQLEEHWASGHAPWKIW